MQVVYGEIDISRLSLRLFISVNVNHSQKGLG